MADGIITQAEEAKLREFRDRLALANFGADRQATTQLDRASRDRLTLDARLAVEAPESQLNGLSQSLGNSGLPQGQQTAILVRAWETTVEGTLEDGLIIMYEENVLNRYMDHFGIAQSQMNQNGVYSQVVKAAVIRDIAEDIVPDPQNINGRVPFNLMKPEKVVWVTQDVDYLEALLAANAGAPPMGSTSGSSKAATTGQGPSAAGSWTATAPTSEKSLRKPESREFLHKNRELKTFWGKALIGQSYSFIYSNS